MTAHSSWLHCSCDLKPPIPCITKPTSCQPIPATCCLLCAQLHARCYSIDGGGPDADLTFRDPGLQSLHHPIPMLGFQPKQVSSDESPSPEIWGFSSMTVISKLGQVFPCHSTGIPQSCQEVLESIGQKGRTGAKEKFLFMASLLESNLGG